MGAILITGAKGRIGRALAAHWRSRDCILLDREDGDLTVSDAAWTERFAGAETVVHLAADPDSTGGYETAAADSISATLNVLRACREHRVQRVIYASSVWAEYEKWGLARTMRWYSASKIAGEALVHAWADETERPAVCLRFGYFDPGTPYNSAEEWRRLSEAGLVMHADDALRWTGPGCSVRYAVGRP